MRPGIIQLISDAKDKGYRVVERGSTVQVWQNKSTGLQFFQDGTAVRADTDLTICKAIRTIREMRRALEL